MKKRRTKKQKIHASQRLATTPSHNLSLHTLAEDSTQTSDIKRPPLIQDVPLIKKDLYKTMVISVVLVFVLIGIFLYLR